MDFDVNFELIVDDALVKMQLHYLSFDTDCCFNAWKDFATGFTSIRHSLIRSSLL